MLRQTNIEARNNNYVTIARHLRFTRKQLFETQSESVEPDDSGQVGCSTLQVTSQACAQKQSMAIGFHSSAAVCFKDLGHERGMSMGLSERHNKLDQTANVIV